MPVRVSPVSYTHLDVYKRQRFYVPGPLLKKGKNTLVIFETEGKVSGSIQFYDEPEI